MIESNGGITRHAYVMSTGEIKIKFILKLAWRFAVFSSRTYSLMRLPGWPWLNNPGVDRLKCDYDAQHLKQSSSKARALA